MPHIYSEKSRRFDCFPVASVVLVINNDQKFLMMKHPDKSGFWQPVMGAMEHNESISESALREAKEELGVNVEFTYIGVVDALNFVYDKNVTNMISLVTLLKYNKGKILPGDDMLGSEFAWFGIDEIKDLTFDEVKPVETPLITEKAILLYKSQLT